MHRNFVVVGAGLAGSIVTRVLRRAGHSVVVIDDDDRYSASQASSNLYIASWVKKYQHAARVGIEVLESLELPTDRVFDRGLADAMHVRHIAQRDILVRPDAVGWASKATSAGVLWRDQDGTESFEPGIPVLCCGYRANELLPNMFTDLTVKVGHRFLFEGELEAGESSLTLVSPYTHGKLYQYAPGQIYYADSVALKKLSFEKRQEELKERTLERAYKALGRELPIIDYRVGYRPILKGSAFGSLRERHGMWSVNGGGKNGMVAYAWLAQELLERINEL